MHFMLRNFLILLGLAALTAGYTVYSEVRDRQREIEAAEAKGIVTGAPAPDFSYVTVEGKTGRLSDHKGKVVILNFWASWCPPCIAEFPQLLNLAAGMPDKIVLLALSSDHDKAMMDRFIVRLTRENGAKATADNVILAWDKDQSVTLPVYGTARLPETIVIDKRMVMREKVAGVIEWDGPEVYQRMAELSAE